MASFFEQIKMAGAPNTQAMPSYAYAQAGPYAAYTMRTKMGRRATLLTSGEGVTTQPSLRIKTLLGE